MNYYSEAIEMLFREKYLPYDAKGMLVEIVKRHPKIFVDVCNDLKREAEDRARGFSDDGMEKALLSFITKDDGSYDPNGFIPAIKRYRELTGSGLKDAKHYMDELRLKAHKIGPT